jgi:hypothetical protein
LNPLFSAVQRTTRKLSLTDVGLAFVEEPNPASLQIAIRNHEMILGYFLIGGSGRVHVNSNRWPASAAQPVGILRRFAQLRYEQL